MRSAIKAGQTLADTRAIGLAALRRLINAAGLNVISEDGSVVTVGSNIAGSVQRTIKFSSGAGNHFSLRKADLEPPGRILAYIWNADTEPEVFLLLPDEATNFLGPKPQLTRSWKTEGYYKWSSAAGMPEFRRVEFAKRFGNRQAWLRKQFSE